MSPTVIVPTVVGAAERHLSPGASFVRSDFRFVAGRCREVHWAGRLRSFCPQCGTPLTFLMDPDANEVDVTVGSFDQPALVTPEDHTWIEDRLPWVHLTDQLPAYQRNRETGAG
jgi:hypothetical protein